MSDCDSTFCYKWLKVEYFGTGLKLVLCPILKRNQVGKAYDEYRKVHFHHESQTKIEYSIAAEKILKFHFWTERVAEKFISTAANASLWESEKVEPFDGIFRVEIRRISVNKHKNYYYDIRM